MFLYKYFLNYSSREKDKYLPWTKKLEVNKTQMKI